MNSHLQTPPRADSLEWMRALVAREETRLERSRAARLGRWLRDTGLPWLRAALGRLLLIALVLVVALASALAIVLVSSGGSGTGALAAIQTWVAAAWIAPDTAAASITRAALAAPDTAALIVVAVASLMLLLCAWEIVVDLRRTMLR